MNSVVRRKFNKGFTLVELIVVIAILAIIMLIATVAYAGIQERMKIRSDKATCAQIGKALTVRENDIDKSKGVQLYPEVVEYDTLENVDHYINPGLTPQSMSDGGYIVTAIQTQTGKKIIVGIGKTGQEISTALYNNKENAGWAWCEAKEVSKFVTENTASFSPAKTLAGITGGTDEGSGGGSGSIVQHYGAVYNAGDTVLSGVGSRLPVTKTNDGVAYYCLITGLRSNIWGTNWNVIVGISDVSSANASISASGGWINTIPQQYVPNGLYMVAGGGNPGWGIQTVTASAGIPTYDYGNNQSFIFDPNDQGTWVTIFEKALELTGFSSN